MQWPDGKRFAFAIFDDTDHQILRTVKPVYDFLRDAGFRTTKSVWPIAGDGPPVNGGVTCADLEYVDWLRTLQVRGFEIGFHNATYHTSSREQTHHGIDRFRELFGHDPNCMANHTGCFESIYWGSARLSGINRTIYNFLSRYKNHNVFEGHVKGSSLFWGDLCKERIKYVRNFVYGDINTLKACPFMPYYDPHRPFVNGWFASAEGPDVQAFSKMVSEGNQDRLEEEGGACIMYSHLALGFSEDGKLNSKFRSLMERLGRKNGWFVPVNELLDHLRNAQGIHTITNVERNALERRWLLHKIRVGPT